MRQEGCDGLAHLRGLRGRAHMLNGLVGLRRAELSAAESVVHDLVLRKKDNDSVTAENRK